MAEQNLVNIPEEDFGLLEPFFNRTRTRSVNVVNTIVFHWTAGATISNDVTTLRGNNLGYHFLIEKNGNIIQGAALTDVVSHGGNSYGPNGKFVNQNSIGISFSMRGIIDGVEEEFTTQQYNSALSLVLDLKIAAPNLKYITGHHWVSPGRKIDPYTFDFNKLISEDKIKSLGLELWKTGYKPFPMGLSSGCSCIEGQIDSNGNCKKSKGNCEGPGGYGYSERNLNQVVSDLSFPDDTITD